MRRLLVIACVCAGSFASGQGAVGKFSALSVATIENRSFSQHTGIQPAIRQQEYQVVGPKKRLKKVQEYFRFTPNPDFAAQYDTALFYRAAAGFSLQSLRWNKLSTKAMFSSGWSTREGVNQIHPSFTPLNNNHQFIYVSLRSRLAYTPNKYLHVAAGTDNQFFGEGYRSLIQGDQTAPNPFAMMRVNVWRLEYGLLYQIFHENNGSTRLWKFGTTHYLSYNVTKKWNVAVFETVFFQPRDGSFKRGVEVEYLNPLVFFRPQEYSVGSSDNVLLALQTSYAFKKHMIYGQLLLDEFVLKEIRSRSRWWANKYGVQLGIKGTIDKVAYRVEMNLMRPYTYAHINDGQNGGNQGIPLAHPLGSNFVEILAQAQMKAGEKGSIRPYGVFQLQGLDQDSVSWGGDIYQSYVKRSKDYGNTIGQGVTVRTVRFGCEFQRQLPKLHSLIYIDPQIAFHWGDLPSSVTPAVTIGWRSNLFQDRKFF